MKPALIICWVRRDLRLKDNPALQAASAASREQGVPLLPLFILEDYMLEARPEHQFGYPSRWFLAQALPQFAERFKQFALVRGKAAVYCRQLAEQYDLTIYVNDDVYVDFYTQVDKLKAAGVRIHVSEDALSVAKETRSKEGNLYSVFSPFKKSVWASFIAKRQLPEVDPTSLIYPTEDVVATLPNQVEITTEAIWTLFNKSRQIQVGDQIIDVDTLTAPPELVGWLTTEEAALARFADYLKSGDLNDYRQNRDSLELDAANPAEERLAYSGKTSRLSPALAWGLMSSRTQLALIQEHFEEAFDNPFSDRVSQGVLTYISELIWREFYRYQLFHHPELMQTEFQSKFRGTIKWVEDAVARERFMAWIKGETGYPVVDAAMKQIAHTGWMHNRSRMIVASILSKNLGVDWRWGQEYFRAALIDLDEAANSGGWQWGASVGADPKPIRIFNPELQAQNYDNSGAYQNKWLGGDILNTQRIPLIEHKLAREEALVRYGLSKIEPRDY